MSRLRTDRRTTTDTDRPPCSASESFDSASRSDGRSRVEGQMCLIIGRTRSDPIRFWLINKAQAVCRTWHEKETFKSTPRLHCYDDDDDEFCSSQPWTVGIFTPKENRHRQILTNWKECELVKKTPRLGASFDHVIQSISRCLWNSAIGDFIILFAIVAFL